jgi:hypothetical protein
VMNVINDQGATFLQYLLGERHISSSFFEVQLHNQASNRIHCAVSSAVSSFSTIRRWYILANTTIVLGTRGSDPRPGLLKSGGAPSTFRLSASPLFSCVKLVRESEPGPRSIAVEFR